MSAPDMFALARLHAVRALLAVSGECIRLARRVVPGSK